MNQVVSENVQSNIGKICVSVLLIVFAIKAVLIIIFTFIMCVLLSCSGNMVFCAFLCRLSVSLHSPTPSDDVAGCV